MEYNLPISLVSDPDNGAQNINAIGSSFQVVFDRPIIIPTETIKCSVQVNEATVWNNVVNITTGVNDQVELTAPTKDDLSIFETVIITIPQGSYNLESLDASVQRGIQEAHLATDSFFLRPDTAQNKVVMHFRYADSQADFTVRGFNILIGFTGPVVPVAPTNQDAIVVYGDLEPQFDAVEFFLIHCDLVSRGIRINNKYDSVVAQIDIDVPTGYQIIYRPWNPIEVPAHELIGETRKQLTVWLTDNKGNFINTNGELFSCLIMMKYTVRD